MLWFFAPHNHHWLVRVPYAPFSFSRPLGTPHNHHSVFSPNDQTDRCSVLNLDTLNPCCTNIICPPQYVSTVSLVSYGQPNKIFTAPNSRFPWRLSLAGCVHKSRHGFTCCRNKTIRFLSQKGSCWPSGVSSSSTCAANRLDRRAAEVLTDLNDWMNRRESDGSSLEECDETFFGDQFLKTRRS